MPHRLLQGLVFAAVVACRRELAPPPASLTITPEVIAAGQADWSETSADGTLVRQTRVDGRCDVVATKADGVPVWTTHECLADPHQLRFLSHDATMLVVIDPMPKALPTAPVAVRTYLRGSLARRWSAAELVTPGALQVAGGRTFWLADTHDAFLVASTVDGVSLVLADGAKAFVSFAAGDVKVARALAAAAAGTVPKAEKNGVAACTGATPCRYTDDQGTEHVVMDPDDIPGQFLARARPIDGRNLSIIAGAPTFAPQVDEPEPYVDAPPADEPAPAADAPAPKPPAPRKKVTDERGYVPMSEYDKDTVIMPIPASDGYYRNDGFHQTGGHIDHLSVRREAPPQGSVCDTMKNPSTGQYEMGCKPP